jgi:hypothetical protein
MPYDFSLMVGKKAAKFQGVASLRPPAEPLNNIQADSLGNERAGSDLA